MPQSGRSWAISTKLTRKPPGGHGIATGALSTWVKIPRRMGMPPALVWEHNSHLGDARATEMGQAGELNVGQLVRERYGPDAVLIGFSTYSGTVTAATEWGGPAERKRVRPALPDSYEALFHELDLGRF